MIFFFLFSAVCFSFFLALEASKKMTIKNFIVILVRCLAGEAEPSIPLSLPGRLPICSSPSSAVAFCPHSKWRQELAPRKTTHKLLSSNPTFVGPVRSICSSRKSNRIDYFFFPQSNWFSHYHRAGSPGGAARTIARGRRQLSVKEKRGGVRLGRPAPGLRCHVQEAGESPD